MDTRAVLLIDTTEPPGCDRGKFGIEEKGAVFLAELQLDAEVCLLGNDNSLTHGYLLELNDDSRLAH